MKHLITILLVVAATSASATDIRYTSTADLEQQISFDDGKDHSDIEEELERRRILNTKPVSYTHLTLPTTLLV